MGKDCSTSITTDASTFGFGGWSEGDWFLGSWDGGIPGSLHIHDHTIPPPESFCAGDMNINVLELYVVLVGLRRWGQNLTDSLIQVVTDNTQVVYMINTGRSANKTCMSLLREIFWFCFIFNVDLFAMYINTKENVFADALSRINEPRMFKCVCEAVTNLNLCCHGLLRADEGAAGDQGE